MRRFLLLAVMLMGPAAMVAAQNAPEPLLPARAGDFLLLPVEEKLAAKITEAQDGKDVGLTISVDWAAAEKLAVSPERLRDFQNVYYRVTGKPGAWSLEERAFSATGADAESKLIRGALGVPAAKKVFFLPGRQHLLVPARSTVTIACGADQWHFPVVGGIVNRPTRAALVRAGQPVLLALQDAVSSATAKVGTPVSVKVAADVISDGAVVIAQGTPVEAHVARVKSPGFLGAPGSLTLGLGAVKALDGSLVALGAIEGKSLSFRAPAGGFFGRGKHIELTSGTVFGAQATDAVPVLVP